MPRSHSAVVDFVPATTTTKTMEILSNLFGLSPTAADDSNLERHRPDHSHTRGRGSANEQYAGREVRRPDERQAPYAHATERSSRDSMPAASRSTQSEHSARGDPRPSQTFGPQYPYADLDAPTAHYARRSHDCQAVDEALGMARTHIQHLERRERDLSRALAHAEETARQVQEQLIQANGELERRLATATNDLANLRSFTVDSADAQALLTSFDDINDAVNDFGFSLVSSLPLVDPVKPSWGALEAIPASLRERLTPFVHHLEQAACPAEEVMLPMMQATFQSLLQVKVLARFAPDQGSQNSSYFLNLQHHIQGQESQEYSARWRALTYKALSAERDDHQFIGWLTDFVLRAMNRVLLSMVDTPGFDPRPVVRKMRQDALNICTMAVKWQDKARGAHLSFDYTTFLPSPTTEFIDAEMERDEFPSAASQGTPSATSPVVLPVMMGLRAARVETLPSGDTETSVRVLRKAHIL